MSDIFVPPNDREAFEESFIEQHPALNLKATSNSGAYWGDGDARPDATRRDELTFAVEMKTRKGDKLTPRSSEYAKAFGEDNTGGQLSKFDDQAVRMITIYSIEESAYSVSIPRPDMERLQNHVDSLPTKEKYVTRRGRKLHYAYYKWLDWKDLYNQIESYAGTS